MIFHHSVDGAYSFFFRLSHDDALAGSQSVGLDDDGSALFMNVSLGCIAIGKGFIGCVGIWYFFMRFLAKTFDPSI